MKPNRVRASARAALLGAVALAWLIGPPWHRAEAWSPPAFDPAHITSYGYRLVYDTEFNSLADIDFSLSPRPGAKLYGRMFDKWGGAKFSETTQHVSVSGGVLTIAGGQLSSIAPARDARGYVGITFQGGGYAEARLQWNRAAVHFDASHPVNNFTNWWPSFYSVPAEYFTGAMAIPGGAGDHFVEDDWFEAWHGDNYGATLHDWFGPFGCFPGARNPALNHCEIASDGDVLLPSGATASPAAFGQTHLGNRVRMPPDPGNGFHVIGALWVSADYAPDHIGYAAFFLDGRRVGRVDHWVATPRGAAQPTARNVFSELDHDHSAIFIGAPENAPLRVDWIHVWQLASVPLSNPPVKPEPGFTGPGGGGT